MGRSLAKKFEKRYKLLNDEVKQKKVDEIGQRIASVCDRQDISYHFRIIEDEKVNALALPGGFIYISSGLIEATESDDQIAAVLAHEVGHAAALHSIKKMQGSFLYTFLKMLALAGDSDPGFHRGSDFAYVSVMVQYTREFEKEADKLSVKYLKLAGFNPNAALEMLDILEEIDKKNPIRRYTYFRTHPPIATRKAVIRQEITGRMNYEDYLDLLEFEEY